MINKITTIFKKNTHNIIILVFVIIGIFLRFYKLDNLNFWGDEAFTILQSKNELARVIELSTKDTGLPLFPIILHHWIKLFGLSERAIRSLSVIFDLGTLITLILIANKTMKRGSVTVVTALYSFNILAIFYAREARAYSLLTFLTAISCLGITNFIITKSRIIKLAWLGVTVFGAVSSIYTHNLGVFTIFAVCFIFVVQIMYHLWLIFKAKRRSFILNFQETRQNILYSIFGLLAIVVSILPALKVISEQSSKVKGWFWLRFDPINSLTETLLNIIIGPHLLSFEKITQIEYAFVIVSLLLSFGFCAYGFFMLVTKKRPFNHYFPFIFFIVGFAGMYLLSFKSPVFYIRYIAFLNPFFILMICYGWEKIKLNMFIKRFVILLLCIVQFGIYYNYFVFRTDLKPHYREAVASIKSQKILTEPVINAQINSFFGINQYSTDSFLAKIYDPEFSSPYFYGTAQTQETDYIRSNEEYLKYPRIWLVNEGNSKTPDFLKSSYLQKSKVNFEGNISVELWEKI
jgi:uncharacterized membrane protein